MAYCFGPRSVGKPVAGQGAGSATEPVQRATDSNQSKEERLSVYEQRLAACEKACADSRDALARLEDEDKPAKAAGRLEALPTIPLKTALPPDTSVWESIVESRCFLQDDEMSTTHSVVLEHLRVELAEASKQSVEQQHQIEQQTQLVEELRLRFQDFEPITMQERFQRLEQELFQKLQNVENSASSKEEQQRITFEFDSRMHSLEEAVHTLQRDMGDQNTWFPDESGIPPAPVKPDEDTSGSLECPAVVEHMLKHMEYALKRSTWDAGFFVFHPVYGKGVSMHQFFSLLVTLLVQCAFCGVCYINFTESVFNDALEQSYASFRIDVGHDNRYLNSVTDQSLIQRLCQRDDGLELVSSQLTNLQNIDGYLGSGDADFWEKFFGGQLMCILALSCWTLTVSAEFNKIEDCSWALLAVPTGPRTRLTFNCADESVHLDSVSVVRRGFCLASCIVRIAMTGFLLYVGGMFLAYESNVPNLLLNTVALEFVLHLDACVFVALAPEACETFLSKMQPFEFGAYLRVGGWEFRLARDALCMGSFVAITFAVVVKPMIHSMTEIEKALCSGYKAFTFTNDVFGFTYVQRRALSDASLNSQWTAVMQQSIAQTIDEDPDTPSSAPYIGYGFSTAPSQFSLTVVELASYGMDQLVNTFNPSCVDLLNWTTPFNYRLYVRVMIRCRPRKALTLGWGVPLVALRLRPISTGEAI